MKAKPSNRNCTKVLLVQSPKENRDKNKKKQMVPIETVYLIKFTNFYSVK